jgi:hypothetical protein
MKATITVQMDNAAFTDDPGAELARILRELARVTERDGPHNRRAMDANGNQVGQMDMTTD